VLTTRFCHQFNRSEEDTREEDTDHFEHGSSKWQTKPQKSGYECSGEGCSGERSIALFMVWDGIADIYLANA
jgi:hypothetical protein